MTTNTKHKKEIRIMGLDQSHLNRIYCCFYHSELLFAPYIVKGTYETNTARHRAGVCE